MEDYTLPIKVNYQDISSGLKNISNLLNDANEAAKKTNKVLQDGFNESTKAVETSNKAITQSAAAYNVTNESLAQLTDALNEFKDKQFTEKDINKLKVYNSEIEKIKNQMERLGTVGTKSLKDQNGLIDKLNTALKLYQGFLLKATNTDQIAKYNKKIEETKSSIEKLSRAGKTGFDSLGNEIKQATGLQEQLTEQIKEFQKEISKATDTDKILKLNKALQDTEKQLDRVNNAGKDGFDELGNKINDAEKSSFTFKDGLTSVLGAIGITFGIDQVVSFGKELFNIAVGVSGVDRAFSSLARPDLLPKLRKETDGFISDFDLEKLTVQANNLNIPVDKLGTLLAFAAQRAKDTDEDVNQLTSDIITGLGRQSTLIIDNLGLSAIEVQKEFKKTGDFTLAVSNIIQQEMQKSGTRVDTLADKVGRLGVQWQNAKQSVATYFAQLFNPDSPDDQKIAIIAEKNLKAFSDFANKTAQERTKILIEQQKKVAAASSFYDQTPRQANGVIDSFTTGTLYNRAQDDARKRAAERLVAEQNILNILKKQNAEAATQDRIQKGITSDVEKAAQVAKLRGDIGAFVVGVNGTAADKNKLIKEANELQKLIDESSGKAQDKLDRRNAAAEEKAKQRREKIASERIQLINQIAQAESDSADKTTEVEIKKENARFQVALNNLNKEKKDFPELQKLIDQAVEAEKVAHIARLTLLEKKQADDRAKIVGDGQKAIAGVLIKDNEQQIKAVDEKYKEIIDKAKKANLYTTDVEKGLASQRAKEVNEVTIKSLNENYSIAQEIAISNVITRSKRVGETEKEFELNNQKAILDIKIQYAEAALKLIANDPSKAKEVAQLRANIALLKKDVKDLNIEIAKNSQFSIATSIQKALGLDDSTFSQLKAAGSQISNLFNVISDSIMSSYQREIDAGQERVDALKSQLDEAQSYFDKQTELKEKGYANDSDAAKRNVDAIKQSLAQEEAARQDNIKRQQDAAKTVALIRSAEIAGNTIEQVSNLATAATKIFKAHAGIPFVGVVIALGAIAALVAGFVAIKSNIKAAAETTKYKKGGEVKGKSHDNGGNKYISTDHNDPHAIEIERGEYIVNTNSTAKHKPMLDAINSDDFSKLKVSDYFLNQMLKNTGVTGNGIAKRLGAETNQKQDAANIIVIPGASSDDTHLKTIAKGVNKLVKMHEDIETVQDMGDHLRITKGNVIKRIWKNGRKD